MAQLSKRANGFTLTELLVSLLILGEIATFTIPKILSSQHNGMKKAIFKEVIATLEQIKYQEIDIGGSTDTSANVFLDNLNAVKVFKTNAITEGCYPYAGSEPGANLHNGAFVGSLGGWSVGWNGAGCVVEGAVIDWNGETGPNTPGDDQLAIIINISNYTCGSVPPRHIAASPLFGNAANLALWNSLW
jgi:prepilin-type N-terminal cleavage/methylation domain-containing protein